MSASDVDAYIARHTPAFAAALAALRARLIVLLPDHIECMSYAMPGFRQPGTSKSGPKGKMVIGYAAFTHHLGLYPHSGSIIPKIDCAPFKTSKSGVLYTPSTPLPDALLRAIVNARQAEIASGYPPKA